MLAKNGKKMGAFYLGGLAIECALKACIAKKTKRYDFPRDRQTAQASMIRPVHRHRSSASCMLRESRMMGSFIFAIGQTIAFRFSKRMERSSEKRSLRRRRLEVDPYGISHSRPIAPRPSSLFRMERIKSSG